MPRPISNAFTEFEFTQTEWYAATRFSDLQLMLLQTLLARAASRRLNVNVTPDDKRSLQEEAEIKGEMSAYTDLMTMFTDTEAPAVEDENKPAATTAMPASIQPKGN